MIDLKYVIRKTLYWASRIFITALLGTAFLLLLQELFNPDPSVAYYALFGIFGIAIVCGYFYVKDVLGW